VDRILHIVEKPGVMSKKEVPLRVLYIRAYPDVDQGALVFDLTEVFEEEVEREAPDSLCAGPEPNPDNHAALRNGATYFPRTVIRHRGTNGLDQVSSVPFNKGA
jgi:hypothetical protein